MAGLALLLSGLGASVLQRLSSDLRDHATARGAHEEAPLDHEWLEHVFDRAAFFGQGRGERF